MPVPKNLNFVGAVRDGENPKGQTSVTPPGLERQTKGGDKSVFIDLKRPPEGDGVQLVSERKRAH